MAPAGRNDPTVQAPAVREIRFGLVQTTPELREPRTLHDLGTALGPLWTLKTYRTYAELVDALREDEVELAWLPPLAYARAARDGVADLLLTLQRVGQLSYAAAIIVRDEPGAAKLDYVRRKRAAWVDVWSAAGYLVPRRMLRAAGLDPDRVFASQSFLGSHAAVVEAVARRKADVGATFCSVDAAGKMIRCAWGPEHRLRALAISEPIPGDTICVSSSVGVRDGQKFAARLGELAARPATREILRKAFGADTFAPGDPARYVSLESALADELPEGDGLG